jgi:hypothetical protein
MNDLVGEVRVLQETVMGQPTTITALKDRVGELELGHGILRDHVIHIEDRMDVDPQVADLTNSDDADSENSSDKPLVSSSSSSDSDDSDMYNDRRQTFLSVPIIDVDKDPAKNSCGHTGSWALDHPLTGTDRGGG